MKKKKITYLSMLNFVVIGNVLCTALIIGMVLGGMYYQNMKENVKKSLESTVSQAENYSMNYVTNIFNVANKLSTDVQLGVAVENFTSNNIEQSVQGKKMMDYILQNAMEMNPAIENILIGTKNRVIQQDGYSIDKDNRLNEIREEEWYKQIQEDKIEWKFTENVYYTNTYDEKPYYLYATKFKNKFYQKRTQEDRIIILTFNILEIEKYIQSILGDTDINLIMYMNCDEGRELIYQYLEDSKLTEFVLNNNKESNEIRTLNMLIEKESTPLGWNYVGIINKNVFSKLVSHVRPWMVIVVFGILFVAIMISKMSAMAVSKLLNQLVLAMEDMSNNEFHELREDTSCVEIDKLILTYNHMSNKIKGLIEEVKYREKEKRKIEYKVLEAQINPHFIYNTLDTIRWVAIVNRSDKIADIIESFIRLLRISLSKGHELILVSEEIILIEEYVKIMIFRNNYEVDVTYDIEEKTRKCYSLKMVLQPFIENCFYYAFGNNQKENKIVVKSYIKENVLFFEVIDNGSGFLVQDKNMKQMTGIGIDNVDERIKVWHGNEYGVEIISEQENGTRICISQPVMWEGDL